MVLATVGLIAVGMAATPARAHDGWWGYPEWRENGWREHEWRQRECAVIGGASIIGTGTPAITATAPTPRRRIISQGLRLELISGS
jgi:hypothetical protein